MPTKLCGVLVFGNSPPGQFHLRLLRVLRFVIQLCHTHNTATYNFVTHTTLSHTTLSHTHNFVTYKLSHTNCHIQLCHIQLCHTHNSVTHTHEKISHTHKTLSHTTFQTPSFTHNFVTHTLSRFHMQTWHFCAAGVALGDVHLRFTWQAWHLATSIFVLRGKRGTYGSGGTLGAPWSRVTPRHFCVAGAALGDVHVHFAWQAWHLVTATFVLRGTRGIYRTGLGLVARLGAPWSRVTSRYFCVAR